MLSKLQDSKKKKLKRVFATLILLVLLVIAFTYLYLKVNESPPKESTIATTGNLTENSRPIDTDATEQISDGVILHAFCWSFNTIKENMADIAKAGYTSIQTSPINEINASYPNMKLMGTDANRGTDGAWWWHYQPTDWKIGNYQLGTRDEFIAMCNEADKYNIKIIVDVVPNHTTGDTTKVSQNLINAGNGSLYHDTGFEDIVDWSDRLQCTRYSVLGLADVDTENKGFQDYFLSYLNDCIACGADGFRYDTAKHIGLPDDERPDGVTNNFWTRVTTETTDADRIFNYAEVLQGENDRIEDYIKVVGSATASNYGKSIRNAINSNNLSVTSVKDYHIGSADTSDIVVWVESHDNYINDGTWQQLDDEEVKLAWAAITARADGVPLFFDRPYGSSINSRWGSNTIGAAGSDLYKDDEVAAVNKFRNAMVGENENLINPGDNKHVLIIERGTRGVVIVNADNSPVNINCAANLTEGSYTSMTDDKSQYSVTNDKLTGTIPSRSVSVLIYGWEKSGNL